LVRSAYFWRFALSTSNLTLAFKMCSSVIQVHGLSSCWFYSAFTKVGHNWLTRYS
jgi:hypothetical protein